MDAKEYYDKERLAGNTYDITSNENPNYHLSFYQNIFRLMESFHTEKSAEEAKVRFGKACQVYYDIEDNRTVFDCLKIAVGLDNLKDEKAIY